LTIQPKHTALNPELSAATGRPQDFEEFIHLISHDVRNSVRALIDLPQWISDDLSEAGYKIDGSLAENIQLMNIHTRRLDRMLYDLLIYSRIGRMQTIADVDLAEVIDTLCQEIRIPAQIKLSLDLQVATLHMGEGDAKTLLGALIDNAVRHRDAKTASVQIATRSEPGAIVLSIIDDGPGIPLKYREKVFGAMVTLKARDEVDSSGMGLAHVNKIIRLYGGTLRWIDQPTDRGVGFELRFAA
jgi:signal transduction histidine kinase